MRDVIAFAAEGIEALAVAIIVIAIVHGSISISDRDHPQVRRRL